MINEGTLRRPYKSARKNLEYGGVPSSRFGEDFLLGGSFGSQYYDIVDNCMDLSRNTSIGKAIIGAFEDYVGGSGLTPVVAGSEIGKKVFNEWAKSYINVEETKDLNQVLRDLIVNSASSGDVLITTPVNPDASSNEVGLRIELTSGSRVKTPTEYKQGEKDVYGNSIKFGVAFKNGKEVGYYVQNLIDSSSTISRALEDFTFIPRFDKETGRFNALLFRNPSGMLAEQTRALPVVFPVVQEIRDLSELWDSAITGARNKNHLSVVVQSDSVSDVYSGAGGINEDGSQKEGAIAGEIIGDLVDGAIMTMPEGTAVSTINSSGLIDLDALFMRSNRYLCAGVGTPVEILMKDFSQTNFSSGKLAMDSWFRKTEVWTNKISDIWTLIYKLVNIEASLKGFGIPFDELDENTLAVEFVGAQNYVDSDPLKGSKSEATRIGTNITTATQELGRRGLTYEQIVMQKANEYKTCQMIAELENVPVDSLLADSTFDKKVILTEEEEEEGEPNK